MLERICLQFWNDQLMLFKYMLFLSKTHIENFVKWNFLTKYQ